MKKIKKAGLIIPFIFVFPYISALGQNYKTITDSIFIDHMLIEGDILVPKDFFLNRACYATNLWTNGIVPYEFDANVTQVQKDSMYLAMAEWEAVATVDFIPRNGENNYVNIYYSPDGNFSDIGMQGGMQELGLLYWGRFTMAHELGHTLGFWHEQSRTDRDTYIQVNEECIDLDPEKIELNFGIHEDAGIYGYYDFMSVMHYPADASYDPSLPGCTELNSITVLPPYQAYQDLIGQRDSLSHLDKLTMSLMYPEDGWKFANYAPNTFEGGIGSFLFPWLSNSIYYVVLNRISEGEVLWIQPGNYLGAGVYNKQVTLRAPLGNVTIQN